MKKLTGSFILIVILVVAGINLYLFGVKPVYSYVSEDFIETDAALGNPYEGMYHIYAYTLTDEDFSSTADIAADLEGDEYRLALVEVNLRNFSDKELSVTALEQLNNILSVFDASDKSLILRLLYDWDGNAKATEPDNIELIRSHIVAAAPIINSHADSIYIMQGLLIGDYGEMHDSDLISDDNLCLLSDLLYSYMDKDIYLAVRTPAQWRLITKSEDPSVDHGICSRLGLFNDGLLGSESDTGTYTLRSREREHEFQSILCEHVQNGGEVIIDNPYNDYENARYDLELIHISYLNSEYDQAVLNKWKNSTETTDPVWRGHTGYEYIENHLGYRFYLSFSDMITGGSWMNPTQTLRITLKNMGFSVSYKPFHAYISLHPTGKKAGDDIVLDVPTDLETLMSEETRSVDISLPMDRLENSDYEVWFYIQDDTTGETILTANDNLVDGRIMLGTINCRSLLKK